MPLTLVANRAPIRPTPEGWEASLGGLATALLPVLERNGGSWVAMRDPGDDAPLHQPYPADEPHFDVRRVPLDADEFEAYYLGMSNRVLWPLAHYMLEHVEPDRGFREGYRRVNELFAEAAVEGAEGEGLFWVHDYHLMLVPEMIRQRRPDAQIGHFWHIPWPAVEVYRVLPAARELLRGMLGASLLGFHTEEYAQNFRDSARVLLGARIEGESVEWEGRRVRVEAHPIGIDTERFSAAARDAAVRAEADAIRADMGTQIILSVDRLDYTKGLLSRLAAFEDLLKGRPDLHRAITLYQITTPSRTGIGTYQQLKREVDEMVGRINGTYGRGSWLPIRYRYRTYTQEELAARYLAAHVAFITPLRDGMNLVAHEFVQTHDRGGVLVLSELTGAAHHLDGALLVNPYDADGLVQTLQLALEMDEAERRDRLARMRAVVARLDVHRWAERFLERLRTLDDGVRELSVSQLEIPNYGL